MFAIQIATRHEDYSALDVSQWEFFVVSRRAVEATGYASIGPPTLRTFASGRTAFDDLARSIQTAAAENAQPTGAQEARSEA